MINMQHLISTACRWLHVLTTCDRPKSETSEPDKSSIFQELSANATMTSSFNNLLLLAIATSAI